MTGEVGGAGQVAALSELGEASVAKVVRGECLGFGGGKHTGCRLAQNVAVVVAAEEEAALWNDGVERFARFLAQWEFSTGACFVDLVRDAEDGSAGLIVLGDAQRVERRGTEGRFELDDEAGTDGKGLRISRSGPLREAIDDRADLRSIACSSCASWRWSGSGRGDTLDFGGREVEGVVIEDRGRLGVGGRRLLRVRLEARDVAEPIELELPESKLKAA